MHCPFLVLTQPSDPNQKADYCEALIQDHTGEIRLLPALPKAWASGSVRGFITRTGETVSFRWEDGKLLESEIKAR